MQIENKKKIIITIIVIVATIVIFVIYMLNFNTNNGIALENLIIGENINEEIDNSEQNIETEENLNNETYNETYQKIAVHIIGEVKKEGLVYLEQGARIIDAIEAAGGATKEADLSQVNLAYELQDGQKIYIPNKKEKISEYITSSVGNNVIVEGNNNSNNSEEDEEGSNKVNINTASQNELDELPGIGPALAQRIVEYREENGNFKNIEELQNVKGIGESKYSDIKDYVTI